MNPQITHLASTAPTPAKQAGHDFPSLVALEKGEKFTVGDAGAYGGSYTLANFPLHTGSARVYMTGHPFNVRSGATLRVRATAWDR